MDNLKALRGLCNALCNTFYPDLSTMELMLFNEGINGNEEAKPKDAKLFQVAVRLVKGYVESSRTENGISTSVREDAIDENIAQWCKDYGLDAEDYLLSAKTIENGSNWW